MKNLVLVVAIAVALVCSNANAQSAYQTDDGTSETSVGTGAVGPVGWGNIFAVDPTATELDSIEIGFGASALGDTANWYVYNDDDGDPTAGLSLLATGSFTVANDHLATGVTEVVSLGGLDISGDSFVFIAADTSNSLFPAAQDQSVDSPDSWVTIGLADLNGWETNGTTAPIGAFLPGNWIVRGNVAAVPEPATAGLLAIGLVGLVSRRRR